MRVFQLRQIPLGQVWASLLTKIPWDIQSVQKAECRLQTKYKMQTEKKNSFLFFSHRYDNLRIVTQSPFQGHLPRKFWKPIFVLEMGQEYYVHSG